VGLSIAKPTVFPQGFSQKAWFQISPGAFFLNLHIYFYIA